MSNPPENKKSGQESARPEETFQSEKDFSGRRAEAVGQKHGTAYLLLSIVSLLLLPLGPVMMFLSGSDRRRARRSGKNLDGNVAAAWVISIIATVLLVLSILFTLLTISITNSLVEGLSGGNTSLLEKEGRKTEESKDLQRRIQGLQRALEENPPPVDKK